MKHLIVFTSPTCAPCNAVKPLLAELAIQVREINIMERPTLAAIYGVKSVPAFVLLDGDTILKQKLGLNTRQALAEFIA